MITLLLGCIIIAISYKMVFSESPVFILKPSALFYILFIILYYVGIVLYTSDMTSLVFIESTDYEKLVNFSFSSLSIVFFALGVYLIKVTYGVNRKLFNDKFINKTYHIENENVKYTILVIAFFISFLICIFHFHAAGIPFFSDEPNVARINFIRGFGYLFIFNSLFNPMISFAGLFMALLTRNKIWKIVFITFSILSMMLSWITLFKSAVVVQGILLFLAYYTYKRKIPNIKSIFILVLVLFLVLFSLILLVSDSSETAFSYLIYRVFLINTFDTVTIINAIESGSLDLLYGASILKDIVANKPGPEMSFQGEMYSYIYNNGVEAGINASYSQLFVDFSWAGIFVYLLLGMIFEYVYIKVFLFKNKIKVDTFIFYTFICYGMANASGYLTKGIFNWTVPILLFIFLYKFTVRIIPVKNI